MLTHPRTLITFLLVFGSFLILPALSLASGATVKVADKGASSRLEVKLSGFSDRGSWRIIRVTVTSPQKKVFSLARSGKSWVSSWQKSIAHLRGAKVTIVVRRLNRTSFIRTIKIPSKPIVPTQIEVDSLIPSWSSGITDFTVACDAPVLVRAKGSEPLSIDGSPPQSGSFSKEVTLTPGQSFKMSGVSEQTVRCRPSDLMLPEIEIDGPRQAAFYMVAPTIGDPASPYYMIFNNQGVPVWWLKETDTAGVGNDFKLISSTTVAAGHGWLSASYDIRNLDGSLVHQVMSPTGYITDRHDMQPTLDGGFLTMSYVPRDCPSTPGDCEDLSPWGGPAVVNVTDGVIQKQDRNGNLVWTWNSRDHIDTSESGPWIPNIARQPDDIIHLNSMEEDGDGFVFSARHLDAVYRVADPGGAGNIDWKLGGTTTPESLTSVDNPLSPNVFGGQHDARILADGTLTVHNNGTRLGFQPRADHYRIDTTARTATLLDSLSDDQVPSSGCCGGARRLPAGGWAVSWGMNNIVGEYDAQGHRVFALHYPLGAFSYRVVPVLADELSASDLRQGMDDQFPGQF